MTTTPARAVYRQTSSAVRHVKPSPAGRGRRKASPARRVAAVALLSAAAATVALLGTSHSAGVARAEGQLGAAANATMAASARPASGTTPAPLRVRPSQHRGVTFNAWAAPEFATADAGDGLGGGRGPPPAAAADAAVAAASTPAPPPHPAEVTGAAAAAPPEADMAIFVQVSAASLPLFPRLMARLHHPRNSYAVHFDLAIPDDALAPTLSLLADTPAYAANVVVMERAALTYRGVSLVLNTLDAMEVALASPRPWSYWLNLSGSDYPLLPITTQRRLLAEPAVASRRRLFLCTADEPRSHIITRDRVSVLHVDPALAAVGDADTAAADAAGLGDALFPVTNERRGYVAMPLYPAIAGGLVKHEAWAVLHRDFVAYAARGAASRRSLLAFAYAADAMEHYWGSLAAGTAAWRGAVVPHCLRQVHWKFRGRRGRQHPLTVDEVEGGGAAGGCPSTRLRRPCGSPQSGTRASLVRPTRR
ncbi:hypothetical protein BU14_0985s0001 [Porphyra umbilicalis]|uniref:Protein xylosyltransferase n=1 Tax=Porphyra umbilicalis TaxID=2786 RepID=A0A1X6NMT0_PORUM|nr:hypothetical protein BU14_0985s0001 [Porphyra umbilicalis]|eukprot:OSX69949.1 hypothetical protein BU14_0985s0001 [Porphyra umbilicalis]